MSPDTLLQHFDAVADAPNGVQKLRELILQLAVRGKLVPQDLSDGPASALLEQIQVEKERLGGRLKPLPLIASEEMPFEAPEGWEWVRFGNVIELVSGQHLSPTEYNEQGDGLPYYTGPAEFGERSPIASRWTHEKRAVARRDDVLLTVKGAGIGKTNILADLEAAISRQLMAIRPVLINPAYTSLVAQAATNQLREEQVGIAIPGIGRNDVLQLLIALPPLPEQCRIVEKVDQLMVLCDDLEERQQRRAEARMRLNRASLHHLTAATDDTEMAEHWQRIHHSFHLLYDAPETVTELRQAILQLAVRGKLVPFDANSATRPFDKILAEPSLNGIATKPHDEPIGTPVLRISAGTSRTDALVDELDHKHLELDPVTIEKFRLKPGDLLACRFNGNLHYVGRLSLYTGHTGQTHVYPDKLIRFRVDPQQADPAYIRYAFNAADTRQKIEAFCATTAGNIGISAGRLKTIEIPVPPLDLQHRIVETVDQLMALCHEMEAKLTRSRTKAERLASAMVHHLTAA